MEAVRETKALGPEHLDYLMQVKYLIDQMTKANIPLEEGYQRLITLAYSQSQKE